MSTNIQNTILLKDVLATYSEQNELSSFSEDQIFELFVIQQITKDANLDFREIEDGTVDGGDDGGIDSFIILINDKSVSTIEELEDYKFSPDTQVIAFITQAKLATSISEKAIDKLYITLPLIFDLNYTEQDLWRRFNNRLVEKILILRKVWSLAVQHHTKMTIHLSYASRANEVRRNSALESKSQQVCRTIRETTYDICQADFRFFSAKELIQLYQKRQSTSLTLKFKENPVAIEYRRGNYGYIGVVRLEDYHEFLVDDSGTIREFILEENVRHYQGEVDVNKGIRKTLEDDLNVDFWWLNNGITMIASKCSPYPRELHLENVQIVNGLQTSYTIGRFYNREKIEKQDNRSILVKVLIVDSDDKETIDKIISSSNKQNPVTPTVLRATDSIQRKLELFFYTRGYYYDRRKNYYKNQNKPAKKIFSIQYAAQAIESILNFNPSAARSKPTTLIKSNKSYESIFDEDRSYEAYLNCCLLHQQVTDFIKEKLPREERSEAKNFAYHISRISASILTGEVEYTANHIKDLALNDLPTDLLNQAYKLLRELLNEYQVANPEDNVLNYISKSSRFTTSINNSLGGKLTIA